MEILWTEKYRPKDPSHFECPPHIRTFLDNPTPQHLLLYGPPGTGKTTFAHLVSQSQIFELNTSDERGIGTVRNKIKTYASSTKHKTIILDECDNLTSDAQQCLRRVIEDFSSTTRFIFITNYLSKIIGPLKSRLLKIKFECTKENYKYLKNVGEVEGFIKDDCFYKDLFVKCAGDLRRALNIMQGIAPFVRDIQNIDDFVGIIPKEVIKRFLCMGFADVKGFVDDFVMSGLSFVQFIKQLTTINILPFEFRMVLSELEGKAARGGMTEILMLNICYKKVQLFNINDIELGTNIIDSV